MKWFAIFAFLCWDMVCGATYEQRRINIIWGLDIASLIMAIIAIIFFGLAWWWNSNSVTRQLAYLSVEDQYVAVAQGFANTPGSVPTPIPSPGVNSPRIPTGAGPAPSFVNIVNTYDGTSTYDLNPNDPGELISITTQNSGTVPGTVPSNFVDGTQFKTTLAPGNYIVEFDAYVFTGDAGGSLQMQLLPTNGGTPIGSGLLNCATNNTTVSKYAKFTVKSGIQSYVLQWSYITTSPRVAIPYSLDVAASATLPSPLLVDNVGTTFLAGPLVVNLKFYIQRMC